MDLINTIEDIISTLPTENGWLSDDKFPLYYYQGFWYHDIFLRGAIEASLPHKPSAFNPSPSDIIICSNPKSGTTWLKALSFAIVTRTQHFEVKNPLYCINPHDLIPLMEGKNPNHRYPDLPLFSTHLPYTSLPGSILTSGCKMVYIWRDPKDAFVSRWHYARKIRPNKDATEPIPLEEAFDLFCRGVSSFGPYWDHVLGYWNAYLDRPSNILFFKYEDMMKDVEVHVKRLAEFLGCPFTTAEENQGTVAKIVEMCSFESLSNMDVNKAKAETFPSNGTVSITNDAFFRRGKVEDWKNYLTEDMARKIDQITVEKLGTSGLTI